MRLVVQADGSVQVDERGKAPGRGAYLCRTAACWQRGAAGALNAPLRTNIKAENREALLAYGAQFAAAAPTTSTGDEASASSDHPDATGSGVA